MKYLDDVKLINNKDKYVKAGITAGMNGNIICAEIRHNTFLVAFIDSRHNSKNFVWTEENMKTVKDDVFLEVDIEDLELLKNSDISDEEILEALPNSNPRWWCKVENGYIYNLLGEKKNKIAYDYNS